MQNFLSSIWKHCKIDMTVENQTFFLVGKRRARKKKAENKRTTGNGEKDGRRTERRSCVEERDYDETGWGDQKLGGRARRHQ